MDGNFVVKSTHKTSNQMSTDLALEHVNKVGKVAGGLPLVGITRSESARHKWCLTYNKRNRLVDETSAMFGLTIDDAEFAPSANKDVGISKFYKSPFPSSCDSSVTKWCQKWDQAWSTGTQPLP